MTQILDEGKDRDIINQWKIDAKQIKDTEELSKFVNHLINDYQHDYGTIIHSIFAAMIAAMRVIDNSPQGGITGFQASCLGWELVEEFFSGHKGCPKKFIMFDEMLYPQYKQNFEKVLSKETAEWLKQEAQKRLNEMLPAQGAENKNIYSNKVMDHLVKVAGGEIPFGWKVEK